MNAKLKEPKKIIRDIFTKYATIEGNVVHAEKLFVINTVINHIFKNKDYRTLDKDIIVQYGELINKFLKNEVDIYWKDDRLLVKELEPIGEHSNGE